MPVKMLRPFAPGSHSRSRIGCFVALFAALLFSEALNGQSTFGTVLGTVKESSGAVVSGAKVSLTNTGTNAKHSTLSGDTGSYEFVNVEVGSYKLEIEAPGFQRSEFSSFDLGGRETKRLDAQLQIATQSTTVNVESSGGVAVQTDTSSIAETKGSRELVDLPVAITTRAQGSTSAMSTLTSQPGVQTDANGNISVAGTLPTQLSMSIDGISTMGPGSLTAKAEGQPSPNYFRPTTRLRRFALARTSTPPNSAALPISPRSPNPARIRCMAACSRIYRTMP